MNLSNYPFVSLIIPAYNSENCIGQCLNAVFQLNYPKSKYEVIVVDNGSTDKTLEIVQQYDSHLFIKPRIHISGMRNFGAAQAKGEILAFVDSDCIVSQNWLISAITQLKDDRIGIVGCGYDISPNPSWIEKAFYYLRTDGIRKVKFIPSGNLLIPRILFDKINGFDEELETGEDCDICYRVRMSGKNVVSDSNIRSLHLGNPKNLRELFLKEFWYGQGMRASFKRSKTSSIFILTNLFSVAMLGLVISFILSLFKKDYHYFIPFLLFFLFIPSLSGVYRTLISKKYMYLFHLIIIYMVYFTARTIALFKIYTRTIINSLDWKKTL